jgi:hypothetical protein
MESNRKARLPWIIVILIVSLVLTFSWLFALLIRNAAGGSDFGSYKALAIGESAQIELTGDGFVYYDGSTITRVRASGEAAWTYLVGTGATISAGEASVAAWAGETMTLLDMETGIPTYSNAQGKAVQSVRVGARYVAAHIGAETDGLIAVMEMGGKRVYEAEFQQETVIDYGFFSGGNLLWAMALDTNGSVPTCEITTYKPGSRRVVGLISDAEQLMYNVTFQSANIRLTGITYLKEYDYMGMENPARRKLVYGWTLMSADEGDDPLMAFVPTGQSGGQGEMKDVRMVRAGLDQIVRMPFACEALVARGGHVYGFSRDGHVMVAAAGRQKVNAYQMPFEIDEVFGVTRGGAAVVRAGGMAYIISLD